MKTLLLSIVAVFALTACNKDAPEDRPGGENNPFATLSMSSSLSVDRPEPGESTVVGVIVNFSRPSPAPGSIDMQTVAGTAQPGEHYESQQTTLNFEEGQQQLAFEVTVHGLESQTENVDFEVIITNARNARLGSSNELRQRITIVAPEPEPVIPEPTLESPGEITLRSPSFERERVTYPVLIPLSGPTPEDAHVVIRSVEDTAIADIHYTRIHETRIDILKGAEEFEFDVELLYNAGLRENVSFIVQFVSAEGIVLTEDRDLTITIAARDEAGSAPTASAPQEVRLPEPFEGEETFYIILPFSDAAAVGGSVQARTLDGSARAGINYAQIQDTEFTFSAGQTELQLPVTIRNDGQATENLEFTLQLFNLVNLKMPAQREITIKIFDADSNPPIPAISVPSVQQLSEPEEESHTYTVQLPLSFAAPQSGSVQITTADGTAQAGVHYEAINQRVTVSSGAEYLELDITLFGDSGNAIGREFDVQLSEPQNVSISGSSSFTVQITE